MERLMIEPGEKLSRTKQRELVRECNKERWERCEKKLKEIREQHGETPNMREWGVEKEGESQKGGGEVAAEGRRAEVDGQVVRMVVRSASLMTASEDMGG